jgi:putative CocE/NonD family hydrolase
VTTTAQRRAGSAARTLARRFGDRLLSRLWRLPPPNDYTVERGIRVPMRDGAELLADHFIPTTTQPAGTLLIRGPYGRRFPFTTVFARPYASHGYHVVIQSVRGTFGSGKSFEPNVHEVADGADTVAWLRQQPWFTGSFATVGLSYLGFTQWALLVEPPPELATAIIAVGPHDFGAAMWGTGSFTLNDHLGWCDTLTHQEDGPMWRLALNQHRAKRRLAHALSELPLGAAGRELLGTGAPWWESFVEHSDCADPFWAPHTLDAALDRVQVPVLLIGGWQDIFLEQTLEQYRRLHDRGVEVALTVGPWTHTELIRKAAKTVTQESFEWLDTHLRGERSTRRRSVRVYVTNRGWHEMPAWPPASSGRVLYLHSSGALAETTPSAATSSFRYDPADPTPTVGGRVMADEAGYQDDTALAHRDDVLTFDSDRLSQELEAIGTPVVELSHSAHNAHVDVFVRLSEVDGNGRSRNVSDAFRRLAPSQGTTQVRLELDAVAHRFRAGSRIRLLIGGGSHPRFARNTGTGEPPITARRLVPVLHTVHHGSSRLVLPGPPNS